MSQGSPLEPVETKLHTADLRDDIEDVERKQMRLLVSYLGGLLALVIAMVHGTFAFPAAVVSIIVLVPLKKAVVRYRALALRKAELVEALRSVRGAEVGRPFR